MSIRPSRCSSCPCGPETSRTGTSETWNWGIYPEALNEYWPWIARSITYGGLATILAFALGFPLAYAIAFRGGAYKNLLLFLVIAPFFTSFLLRTISWKIILADNGMMLGPLKELGVVPHDFRLLATPAAVVAGITYNFLPFMTLPLYVALEKIDRRLIEAAEDLYAGRWRPRGTIVGAIAGGLLGAVVGVVMEYGPLSLGVPGLIVGALVGTFLISRGVHPGDAAAGRARHLRRLPAHVHPGRWRLHQRRAARQSAGLMIGNVIQARYLKVTDYPTASALSFILMLAILTGVLDLYTRLLGTEELTGAA